MDISITGADKSVDLKAKPFTGADVTQGGGFALAEAMVIVRTTGE